MIFYYKAFCSFEIILIKQSKTIFFILFILTKWKVKKIYKHKNFK